MADQKDMYPNILTAQVTLSAANTLTFEEITVGLNLFDKAALVISRIEYEPTAATVEEMTAASDDCSGALVNSNNLANLNPDQVEVIDGFHLHRVDLGTAATGIIRDTIIRHDFSTLGGGGLLVAPKPLYVGMVTAGLASAGVMNVRLYFRILRLNDMQYLELLETRNAFG